MQQFEVPKNDYQSNLAVVDRFPFSLYHHPIRDHLLGIVSEEFTGQPLSILNVGCGMSQILEKIDPQHHYFGTDIDPRNIEHCQRRYGSQGAQFSVCQPFALPFESDSMDVVFATEVVEHILEPERWLRELLRVLKPGGRIQLSTPNYGDFTLPLIESTFLELVARSKGFTRKGLHPMPFTSKRLVHLLRSVGMEEIQVNKTPAALALVASARKLGSKNNFLSSVRLRGVFSELTRAIPVSLAVREVMRLLTLYRRLPESTEVLDVGCGDGSFWRAYPGVGRLTLDGVDLEPEELHLARKSGVYRDLWTMDISQGAPGRKYPFVVGNCSLEHVPHIHRALVNIRESLDSDGRLILFVPAFGWSRSLSMVRMLSKFSNRLAMAASGALDGFFQHHHIYDANSWQLLVEAAGYEVVHCKALGSPIINRVFESQLPPAFMEFLYKSLLKRYPSAHPFRSLPREEFFQQLAAQPVELDSQGIVEYALEARVRR